MAYLMNAPGAKFTIGPSIDQNRVYTETVHSGLIAYWDGTRPVDYRENPSHWLRLASKRCLDLVLASFGLTSLLALFIAIAITIKLTDGGPVFFRQVRIGKDGRPFSIFKFRTMGIDSCDASGVRQTSRGDGRVTAFGALLRRKSIDELPQLINVLRGEMSLVGPRPHVPGMMAAGRLYEDLVPYYRYREGVLPGMTGWAQANGYRGSTADAAKAIARIEHDIAYIQNPGLLLDLRILCPTVWREFLSGSAD